MNGLLDRVIRASIGNRTAVLLVAAALAGLGAWKLGDAHLDALPSFTPPMVAVQAEAPGYGSAEVERLVTTPLERALRGLPHLRVLRSTSTPGLAVVSLSFASGTDIFRARQLTAEALARARAWLPPSLPAPQLTPIVSPVGALLKLTYTTSRGGTGAFDALSRFVSWTVAPRLRAIPGVARVTVHGARTPRIEVRPRPERMAALGVSLDALRAALASAQGRHAPGFSRAGPQRLSLRVPDRWTAGDLDAIASTVLARRAGVPVRVRDVATVTAGAAPPVGRASYDGRRAVYLQVDKLPWADTLALTRRVEGVLASLDAELPAGARRNPPLFRQADFVRTSLASVGRAMWLGALLVVAIIAAFLRSPRASAVSLVALPLSILAAAAVLVAAGVAIDGMVLGGLAIAVGEVVDDAIVDVENIWRRLGERPPHVPALEVIHDASVEVRGAVVYASLLVVVVLLPVAAMGGLAGRLFSPLATAYMLAVSASLVVALTVTPALSAVLLGRTRPASAPPTRGSTPAPHRLLAVYDGLLRRVQRRPGLVLAGAVIASLGSLAAVPFLGASFLPDFREGVLIAEIDGWPGTSLDETARLAHRIDRALHTRGHLPHVGSRIGRASLDEDAAPVHRIEMDLVLPPGAEDPDEAARPLLDTLSSFAGIRYAVDGFLGERINELLVGERAPLAVQLTGGDLETLRRAARAVLQAAAALPGVERAQCRDLADEPVRDVRPDPAALARAGLAPAALTDAVAMCRQGLEVAAATCPAGISVPVVLARDCGERRGAGEGDIPVWTDRGAIWPLSALARVAPGAQPAAVRHLDGQPVVTVTVWPHRGQLVAVAERLAQRLRTLAWPQGGSVHWEVTGRAAERRRATRRLFVAAAAVLAAVFAFLWLAFGSLTDALVVIGGIPAGLAGGVVAALALPEGVSLSALVGFVTLAGIISRNGIMLVAHKNHLLAAHPDADRSELIVRAARERLRPIVMTALAAFGGLLPLALSLEAAGSELEAPMALIVCAGLVTSTALNLVAVPAFYLWRQHRRRGSEA